MWTPNRSKQELSPSQVQENGAIWGQKAESLCSVLLVTFSLMRTCSVPWPPFLCVPVLVVCSISIELFCLVGNPDFILTCMRLHRGLQDPVSRQAECHLSVWHPLKFLACPCCHESLACLLPEQCHRGPFKQLCAEFQKHLQKQQWETAVKVKYLNGTFRWCCLPLWLCPG